MIQLPPLESVRVQSVASHSIAGKPENQADPVFYVEGYPEEKFQNLKEAVGHINPPEGKYVPVFQRDSHTLGDTVKYFFEGLALGALGGATLGVIAGFITGAIFGPSTGLTVGSVLTVVGGVGGGLVNCSDEYHDKKYQGYLVNKPFSHPEGVTHNHLKWVSIQGCSSIETLLSDLTASVEQDQNIPKAR